MEANIKEVFFIILGGLIVIIANLAAVNSSKMWSYELAAGKTFKINDSTYKCKMINTLTYGEE